MSREPVCRLLLSAGEPSGDLLGAGLMAALRIRRSGLTFEGVGGSRMVGAGLRALAEVDQLGAIGFTGLIGAIPRHLRLYRRIMAGARAGRYQGAVLIDYPGFHLRLGEALRRAGVPVIQYVAPQLWAWHASRLPRLARAADEVAAVLPFEEAWFRERGLVCRYVGHPAADRSWSSRADALHALGITKSGPVLGIFPGSREGEIGYNWPLFRDVGQRLLAEGACVSVVVAATPTGYYPGAEGFEIRRGVPDLVLAAATAAVIKSGSTTLEAALAGTPMVVAYRTARLTYEIARRQMTVSQISLVNLIAGEAVVPEFWHPPVSAAPVADAVRPLLDASSPATALQLAGFTAVRARLGERGASARVADLLLGRLTC